MKFKVYYYEQQKSCIITKDKDEIPVFETIKNDRNSIVINIEEKSVENMYDFFRNNVLIAILSGENKRIEIDYSEIDEKEFFHDAAFLKLKQLIDNLIEKTNETINKCLLKADDEISAKEPEGIMTINDFIDSME